MRDEAHICACMPRQCYAVLCHVGGAGRGSSLFVALSRHARSIRSIFSSFWTLAPAAQRQLSVSLALGSTPRGRTSPSCPASGQPTAGASFAACSRGVPGGGEEPCPRILWQVAAAAGTTAVDLRRCAAAALRTSLALCFPKQQSFRPERAWCTHRSPASLLQPTSLSLLRRPAASCPAQL